MACTNALMLRYQVTIKDGTCPSTGNGLTAVNAIAAVGFISGITKVNGLDLGEEGTIEVPDWETKYTVSDGKRTLPQLEIQYRIDADLINFKLMSALFNNRAQVSADIEVLITKRDWTPLYIYKYISCQMRKHSQEGMELGSAKLGYIDTLWSPSDVQLLDCAHGILVAQGATIPGACTP